MPTFGAAPGHEGVVNVGVASHITAASPDGPRYDPNLTPEQRRHQSNGIWLCQNDGKLVDSDSEHFTVEKLREWKQLAEERSFRAIVARGGVAGEQIGATVPETVSDELIEAFGLTAEDDLESVTSRLKAAAKNDVAVFRRMPGWPRHPVALNLRMIHGGAVQPFDAGALSSAVETFKEITVVAPPGTGKTTTLLQVVEGVISRGNSVAVFLPLGEWSSQSDSLLHSIVQRQAFVGESEGSLKLLAHSGQLVLVMDGWNELDPASRVRARGEIKKLQREFPDLAIVVSTRRQALDVPISGPQVEIDTLTESQQMEIAYALRGSQGETILDHAWRTPGVRDLIAIPLYLTSLLAHTTGDRLPTTKEEVLRLFVIAQEGDAEKAEMLRGAMFGFHSQILTALAVEATNAETTSLSDVSARAIVARTEDCLIAEGQITEPSQPMVVLDVLVSHHLLVRAGGVAAAISFQHQQFQEWYASFEVEALMRKAGTGDAESRSRLRVGPLDIRAWEESVLFACERVSRADRDGERAVAAAILDAMQIDPMLAAEMIYRSSPAVWEKIKDEVTGFATHWHSEGTVDRAVRFMITTGKAEFASQIWPLILHENDQVYLRAFRLAYRFRPSVLGSDVEERIAGLPDEQRAVVLSQFAHESGIDGIELAARIAARDGCAQVRTSVIEALLFRRADRLVAGVPRTAPDEVWSSLAHKGYVEDIVQPDAAARLRRERQRFIEAEIDPLRKLRALLDAGRRGTRLGAEIGSLIESAEFPARGQHAAWGVDEAYKLYPDDVTKALIHRLQAGLEVPFRSDEILRMSDLAIDDGPLVDLVMGGQEPRSAAGASMGVLGPNTVGRLIDKLIAMKAELNKPEHRADRQLAEQYHDLLGSISRTRPSSFAKAVLERSSTEVPEEIGLLAELISRHGKSADEMARTDCTVYAELIGVVGRWAEVLLGSSLSSRSQLASLAMAIGRLSAPQLAPVLGRMLAEDLTRWRLAREEMMQAHKIGAKIDPEVRSSAQMGHTLQYRHAFAAIGGDEVIQLMKSYLCGAGITGFGVDAAHVLKEIWEREQGSGGEKRIVFGTDFSEVKNRRAEREKAGGAASSPFADAIFDVVDDLIKSASSEEDHRHAVQLAVVGFSMPHGDREHTKEALLQLPQSPRERQTLFRALVLAGEIVFADMLLDGLRGLLEEAKSKKRWLWDQNSWWEVERWLEMLPFSDRPMATLDGLELIEANHRQPWHLRGVLNALSYAPSSEADDVLKALARKEPGFLKDHDWIGALKRRGMMIAARTLLEFIAEGAFSQVSGGDVWWLSRNLADAMQADCDFRIEVYRQYERAADGPGSGMLESAIAEAADEEGVLILIRKHAARGKSFSGDLQRAIEHAAVGKRPSEDWAGASETFAVAVSKLRKALFAMTETDTAQGRLAKECLIAIDEIRDEYGPAESEPRHPDIDSGRPWPMPLRSDGSAT
jgi:hypothetical protein